MVAFLIGGIMILVGILIKIFPNLIAGYNTMSKEEKKNVDVKALSSFMLWAFIVLGVVVIGAQILFNWSETESVIFPILILLPGFIIIAVWVQKYDHNK